MQIYNGPAKHFCWPPTNRLTEMTGPLKPRHAEFLQQLMAEYGGTRLTKVNIWSTITCIITYILFVQSKRSAGAWKGEELARGAGWQSDWGGKLLFLKFHFKAVSFENKMNLLNLSEFLKSTFISNLRRAFSVSCMHACSCFHSSIRSCLEKQHFYQKFNSGRTRWVLWGGVPIF